MKINVPTSWQAVTLRKYQAMTALFAESNEKGKSLKNKAKELHDYHTECALISLLTDCDMGDILALHRGAHNRIMNELSFIEQPVEGKLRKRYRVNGRWYYFERNARQINGGQWSTIMHFLEDADKIDENLHNLMACFAYRYEWFRSKYNGKIHEAIAEDMLELPMTVVKPLTDFFLKDWLKSVENTAVYLEIKGKMLKRKAERLLARSSQNTDGSTR